MKARALAVLGDAMQRRSYWRPAIDALKASLALAEAADVREAYEKLRAEHGFRMTDYSTDGDAATPRVCIQFSENLSRGQTDFAKFVSVNGTRPAVGLRRRQPALHRRRRARPALRDPDPRRPSVRRQRSRSPSR